jgi:molybdopterin converting factor small subunit
MTVTFYGGITRYTNDDKSYTPKTHATLRSLLEELGEYYGEQFVSFVNGNETCIILINGKGIMLSGGLDSVLSQDDKIEILPFVDAG